MAKKIDIDSVIGNALIFIGKEKLTRGQIYHYIHIVDKLLPEGYYTYGNDDVFDNFCDRYPFIVEVLPFGNTILVKSDKNALERYFKIGLSREIIKVFEDAATALNEVEETKQKTGDNFNQENIDAIRSSINEDLTVKDNKVYRMVEKTGPCKVKVNKRSRIICAKSLLK